MDLIQRQVESEIKALKNKVALCDSLNRLSLNRDFLFLIQETYFGTHAAELVLSLATESIKGNCERDKVLQAMYGVSHLKMFISDLENNATKLREDLQAAVEEYQRILMSPLGEINA